MAPTEMNSAGTLRSSYSNGCGRKLPPESLREETQSDPEWALVWLHLFSS